MNPFDDPPSPPPEPPSGSDSPSPAGRLAHSSEPLAGDPLALATPSPAPVFPSSRQYPEDLQITWSWLHGVCFFLFAIASLVLVNGLLFAIYLPQSQKFTKDQMEHYLLSKPQVTVGGTVAVYALLLFFLYVTLALLPGRLFWSTLGWRRIPPKSDGKPRHPLIYFFSGCGLALLITALTTVIKPPAKTPIEELFKFKQTAMLFVAVAVLVAPLAEETIFRGYLYPVFARWLGVSPSIALTGVLFGLIHGPQLGGAKSLIAVMSLVGIIFTLVRARTGSVFASYLMHLGYNSLLGVSLILATHGFTQVPVNH